MADKTTYMQITNLWNIKWKEENKFGSKQSGLDIVLQTTHIHFIHFIYRRNNGSESETNEKGYKYNVTENSKNTFQKHR